MGLCGNFTQDRLALLSWGLHICLFLYWASSSRFCLALPQYWVLRVFALLLYLSIVFIRNASSLAFYSQVQFLRVMSFCCNKFSAYAMRSTKWGCRKVKSVIRGQQWACKWEVIEAETSWTTYRAYPQSQRGNEQKEFVLYKERRPLSDRYCGPVWKPTRPKNCWTWKNYTRPKWITLWACNKTKKRKKEGKKRKRKKGL